MYDTIKRIKIKKYGTIKVYHSAAEDVSQNFIENFFIYFLFYFIYEPY